MSTRKCCDTAGRLTGNSRANSATDRGLCTTRAKTSRRIPLPSAIQGSPTTIGVDIAETVLEAKPGGAVYDRGVDGSVFAWLINPQWQIEEDEARTSEVEVRFSAIDEGTTHVELRHHGLARHGAGWEGAAGGLEEGWPLYLHRFQELCV